MSPEAKTAFVNPVVRDAKDEVTEEDATSVKHTQTEPL
jgi:hypothetical protein